MKPTDWISSRDGTKLFTYNALIPKSDEVVVLVHGFAEHIGRYNDLIRLLNQANLSVLGLELRGHGRSHGKRGYIDSIEQYEEDLDAAVLHAKKLTKHKKVFLLAHSMGGLVASLYAAHHPNQISGMVLSSPLFQIAVQVPGWKQQLSKLMSSFLPWFSLPNTMESRFLTHDAAIVRAYNDDPLVFHHVTARWFQIMMQITPKALEAASQIQVPLLLQLSQDDHVVDFETSKEWYSHLTGIDSSLKIYEGFYHEIYNELRREEPLSDMLEWLKRHAH